MNLWIEAKHQVLTLCPGPGLPPSPLLGGRPLGLSRLCSLEAGGVGNGGEERGRADGEELEVEAGFRARGEGGQGRRWPGGVLPRPRPSDTRLAWFLRFRGE